MKSRVLIAAALMFAIYPETQPIVAQADNQSARMIDEYGDVDYEDEMARLDNFAISLQNEPNAKAHIIVYRDRRSLPGLNYSYGFKAKNYLTNTRGINPDRIVTVDGGIRLCLSVELWLVPPGAAAPPLKWTYTYRLTEITATFKFDEHGYSLPHDLDAYDELGSGSKGVAPELLGGYAATLTKKPDSRAFIIAYAQYCKDCMFEGENQRPRVVRDPQGTTVQMLKEEKGILINRYGISPRRITTVDGGYRRFRNIELWIVPKGADAPVPSPTMIPMKRRKS